MLRHTPPRGHSPWGVAIDSNRRRGVDWGRGGVARVNNDRQCWVVPVLVALIAAGGVLGSVLGSVHIWYLEENAQRLEQDRLRQESLYRGLVEGLTMLSSGGSGAGFVVESDRALLYASDDVLRAVAGCRRQLLDFADHLDSLSVTEQQALNKATAKIYLAVRKELWQDTTMDELWAERKWARIGANPAEVERYLQETRATGGQP